jgi:uncharacterized protein YcgL (UPF0745 family)
MLIMPIVLKKASKEKVYLLYIDGRDWRCFLLLAVFMANYKEQVMLIGIKSGYKCLTCYIYINKQHDLMTAIQRLWLFYIY